MASPVPCFDVPPYRLSGVVYSAQLNDPRQLLQLGDAVHQPPYKAPPVQPVLAVRPRNALAADGQAIAVPAGGVRTGASLGLVVGRTACRLALADAAAHIAGYLIANDLSLPLASHYRPAVRQMARDGFCPLGPAVVPAGAVSGPDDLAITLLLDGQPAWQGTSGGRVRSAARLLCDVSAFMTLQPGDVLLLGISADAPLARAGQAMAVAIAGLGMLHNTLVAEAA
jgi:5-oxopent-3-ene-1,2,5-tricarboxylate decarboxylase/2-hydroxyhepta-2,4-diene-1,7-dioate isomerase